jgi:hypothetical protein
VLQIRKTIYSHEVLTRSDMTLVFAVARRAGRDPCPEWTSLFCEALTDYVVHQNDPPDYIPQDKADWLIAELKKWGGISSKTEFAMLIDVMTSALGVPPSLATFALQEIETAIVQGRRDAITGEDHPAGVVTGSDVEALRAVLYAATTGTVGHVTREEAEALFAIAHTTAGASVDPSFDDLFARAVGNYLMAISLRVPDAEEALHREHWLDEKEQMSGFVGRMFSRAKGAAPFHVLKSPGQAYEADMANLDAEDAALRAEAEKITASEAAWVIAHLTRSGDLTSAEKRLLQFLGAEAASIPPVLRTLVDQANRGQSRAASG